MSLLSGPILRFARQYWKYICQSG